MKAAVWYGLKDVKVVDVNEPLTPDNKIKVKVKSAGICGSDLHAYAHGLFVSTTEHPITGKKAPITLGHEFAGVVSEIGKGVKTNLKVGDKVAIEPNIFRADDPMVKKGLYNLSKDAGFVGLQDDGGFAEYCVLEPHMVHKIPDSMSFDAGAMVEPAAVALQAVRNSTQRIGDSVVVYGCGPIGLLTIMCAKLAGANKIVATDISPDRMELAKKAGATHLVDGKDNNVTEQILQITGGADVTYECAGVQATFDSALQTLRAGGELMVVAAYAGPVSFNSNLALLSEKKVSTSIAYRNIYPQVIEAMALKHLDVEKIITKHISLNDIVKEGFDELLTNPSHSKIIVDLTK